MTRRRPSRALTEEERALWRRTAKAFKPLNAERLKRLDDPAPPPAKTALTPQSAPVKTGAVDRNIAPKTRKPVDRGQDRKLRRGQVEIEARIDLHGLTRKRARADLLAFLNRAQAHGLHRVLVITGKGAGARALDRRKFEPWDPESAPLPGVLRRSFTQWMDDPAFAGLVSGYAEANRRHGGAGAFYVMLRR